MATSMTQAGAGTRVAKRAPTAQPLARIEKELAALRERQDVLFAALGFGTRTGKGDRGTVGELNEAVLKIPFPVFGALAPPPDPPGSSKTGPERAEKMSRRVYH